MHKDYTITHLKQLESEAIYILRETAAQFEKPVLLFSGGKDSIVMAHLAKKAFWPAKVPFPLMHVDTGHNFPETMQYRDQFVKDLGADLVVVSVQKAIDDGKVVEETGPYASRNGLQTVALLDGIEYGQYDAALGGGRRDEEKLGLKNGSSLIEMHLVNGTLKIKDQNFGIYLMDVSNMGNTLEFFLCLTGLKWISGNTLS